MSNIWDETNWLLNQVFSPRRVRRMSPAGVFSSRSLSFTRAQPLFYFCYMHLFAHPLSPTSFIGHHTRLKRYSQHSSATPGVINPLTIKSSRYFKSRQEVACKLKWSWKNLYLRGNKKRGKWLRENNTWIRFDGQTHLSLVFQLPALIYFKYISPTFLRYFPFVLGTRGFRGKCWIPFSWEILSPTKKGSSLFLLKPRVSVLNPKVSFRILVKDFWRIRQNKIWK